MPTTESNSTEQISKTQAYLEQHHGGDGDLAAQRTLDNFSRHHNEDFWSFWAQQTKHLGANTCMTDLGCAAGQFLQQVAKEKPGWCCTGFECAPYMLGQQVALPANANVIIDDLNAPDAGHFHGTLDIAMANMLIHELHQPIALLRTLKQWLKPGGRLVLIDMVRQPLQSYMEHSDPDLLTKERPDLEEAFLQYQEHNRYTPEDLIWMLEQCGYRIVFREDIRSGRAVRLVADAI